MLYINTKSQEVDTNLTCWTQKTAAPLNSQPLQLKLMNQNPRRKVSIDFEIRIRLSKVRISNFRHVICLDMLPEKHVLNNCLQKKWSNKRTRVLGDKSLEINENIEIAQDKVVKNGDRLHHY